MKVDRQNPADPWRKLVLGAGLFLGFALAAPAQSGSVMIFLKDGRSVEALVESIGDKEISYKILGVPTIQKMTYDGIDFIEFPQPDAWIGIVDAFDRGQYAKVVDSFKEVSLQKGASTGYPAPGNFATLAERRLIDCYRYLRMPGEIAHVRKRIEWDKLPVSEQNLAGVIDCWAAVGEGRWEEARDLVVKTEESLPDTDPEAAELAFLKALIEKGSLEVRVPETEEEIKAALEAQEEAVVQFGRVFGPDAGAYPDMANDAMRQSIEALIGKEDRVDELRALVHLYAGLHGNGELWADADAALQHILEGGIEVAFAITPEKDASEASEKPAGPVRARYLRIERVADVPTVFSLAEVKMFGEERSEINLGKKPKVKQSSDGKIGNRKFPAGLAVDGKPNPEIRARSFARTNAEELPWWELDLGAMKRVDEILLFNCKNNNGDFVNPPGAFRVLLLDGDRNEVFKREGVASPEPRASVKVGGGAAAAPPKGENPAEPEKPARNPAKPEKPAGKPAEKPAGKPAEPEKPAEKPAGKPAEPEKPAEKPKEEG